MFKCGKVLLTKNKHYEIKFELSSDHRHFFMFELNLSYKTDHSGLEFFFKFFKFYMQISFYDGRHWCEQCNAYRKTSCYIEGHDGMDPKIYEDYL